MPEALGGVQLQACSFPSSWSVSSRLERIWHHRSHLAAECFAGKPCRGRSGVAAKEAEEGEKNPDPTALFTSQAFSVPLKQIPLHRECSHWGTGCSKQTTALPAFHFLTYLPKFWHRLIKTPLGCVTCTNRSWDFCAIERMDSPTPDSSIPHRVLQTDAQTWALAVVFLVGSE